ncbi:MAG: TRAP transporter small permease [Pseudomonadota bacterium]
MSGQGSDGGTSISDTIEETFMAATLAMMTLITFANVVARYIFDSNILWALEATVFLFAWLVLLGASYGIKKRFHIGVDVIVNLLPAGARRTCSLFAAVCCIAFAALMLKGAWDYWSPFIGPQAFYETDDVPMPSFLQFLADWLNDGERYEKIPRFIPYAVLPISMALLLYRLLQGTWRIVTGKDEMLIVSHEVEDQIHPAEKEEG